MISSSLYLDLQVILKRQNVAERLLLTITYLLMPYLDFFFGHDKSI